MTRTRGLERWNCLVDAMTAASSTFEFDACWHLVDLRSGREADWQGRKVVPASSTRKISIMMAVMSEVAAGRLSLDQPIEIEARFQDMKSCGCFQYFRAGQKATLREFLIMMMIISDNTSAKTLASMVGLERLNRYCREVGMADTHHVSIGPIEGLRRDHPVDAVNRSSMADTALLLKLMLSGATHDADAARLRCTPAMCALAFDNLGWQQEITPIRAFLPEGARGANKHGIGYRNYNDAGFVYSGETPVFAIAAIADALPAETSAHIPGLAAGAMHISALTRMAWDALAAGKDGGPSKP